MSKVKVAEVDAGIKYTMPPDAPVSGTTVPMLAHKAEPMPISAEAKALTETAREALRQAVLTCRQTQERTGPTYALVVEAVQALQKLGEPSKAITDLIAKVWGGSEKSRGISARYVTLARWTSCIVDGVTWRDSEIPLQGGVIINGFRYGNPIEALKSGKVTFTGTYTAFSGAIQKARGKASKGDEKVRVPFVQVDDAGKAKRVRDVMTAETDAPWREALGVMLRSAFVDNLPPSSRAAAATLLAELAKPVKAAKAA